MNRRRPCEAGHTGLKMTSEMIADVYHVCPAFGNTLLHAVIFNKVIAFFVKVYVYSNANVCHLSLIHISQGIVR
mgnify:CR=1 FL=1